MTLAQSPHADPNGPRTSSAHNRRWATSPLATPGWMARWAIWSTSWSTTACSSHRTQIGDYRRRGAALQRGNWPRRAADPVRFASDSVADTPTTPSRIGTGCSFVHPIMARSEWAWVEAATTRLGPRPPMDVRDGPEAIQGRGPNEIHAGESRSRDHAVTTRTLDRGCPRHSGRSSRTVIPAGQVHIRSTGDTGGNPH
ncbi:hypothetical protein BH24ACT15_BH24ACT15_09780 [soil metagenome]